MLHDFGDSLFSFCVTRNLNKLCAWRHSMPPPLQVDNIFVFICQVAPVAACWLFKTSTTPFDLESGVRVTCDMGYLCANFSLPNLLCSRVRSYVRDRQMSDRRQTKASLNASTLLGWRHNKILCYCLCQGVCFHQRLCVWVDVCHPMFVYIVTVLRHHGH